MLQKHLRLQTVYSLYLTYEELKPPNHFLKQFIMHRLYLTYEELKPGKDDLHERNKKVVYILPMRN